MRPKIDSASKKSEYQPRGVRHSLDGTDLAIGGMVDAIIVVACERKALLDRMRSALEARDNEGALNLARQLCGLSDKEEPRTPPSVNRGKGSARYGSRCLGDCREYNKKTVH
jgi:hypothetical protein